MAKGLLVQTTLYIDKLRKIIETNTLGVNSNPIGSQPPMFKDVAISFCSYFCKGYPEICGNREGVVFETDFPVVYACPMDTFGLLRDGNWIPGHEKFLFKSIEEMLEKYPTSKEFKKDFREYFRALNPVEIRPEISKSRAEMLHETDYCLFSNWNPGYNEVTFPKPTIIKNPRIVSSKEELEALI